MSSKKNEIAGRLAELMTFFEFEKPAHLADKLGVSRQYVYELLGGKKVFKQPFLKALAGRDININWLLTGEGQMLEGGKEPEKAGSTPRDATTERMLNRLMDDLEAAKEEIRALQEAGSYQPAHESVGPARDNLTGRVAKIAERLKGAREEEVLRVEVFLDSLFRVSRKKKSAPLLSANHSDTTKKHGGRKS